MPKANKKPVKNKKSGSSKSLFSSKRIKLIFGILVVLAVAGIGTYIYRSTFAVTYDWTFICNSSASDTYIRVKPPIRYQSPSQWFNLPVDVKWGDCTKILFNGDDNIRVDVDPDFGGQPDIDSYKIGEIGVGYGGCHYNSENSSSDPPDSYNWNGIRYRNYRTGNCT